MIYEAAHRFGDELLLWESWGRIGEPGSPVTDTDARRLDAIAVVLLAADEGDEEAERSLPSQSGSSCSEGFVGPDAM